MNRLREQLRGDARHGSCGMGVGETASDALRAPDRVIRAHELGDAATLRRRLMRVREEKWEEACCIARDTPILAEMSPLFADDNLLDAWVANCGMVARATTIADAEHAEAAMLQRAGTVLFEGAQGVLLDEWHGFHPYTTWSTTTTRNAEALLARHHYDGRITRLGALRAYATRHGPGPFVTEDATLSSVAPEPHNTWGTWQRDFRVGHFDAVMGRYALAVTAPIDGLAISHLDRVAALPEWRCAYRYGATDDEALFNDGEIRPLMGTDLAQQERLTQALVHCIPQYATYSTAADVVCAAIEETLGLPVLLQSFGPTANDKTSRLTPALTR